MPEAGAAPRRILIIKPSSLGDIVHALPVLTQLRETWPAAHIAWLVATPFAELLRGHPLLDEVIVFDRGRFGRMWYNPSAALDFWRFVRELRGRAFDLVIDLQALFRSGFLAWAGGAGRRIGPADAREMGAIFYTDRVRYPPGAVHAIDKNLAVVRALGIVERPPRCDLPVDRAAELAFRRKMESAGHSAVNRFIAVAPGARWSSKQMPAARLGTLLDVIDSQTGVPLVLFGAKSDGPYAAATLAAMRARVVNLIGETSIPEMVAGLAAAECVLCHDSGPMHIAAALGRPIVALFGPTDERRTGPVAANARLITNPVACRPCMRRVCPLAHQDCLARLDLESAAHAVREALLLPKTPPTTPNSSTRAKEPTR